MRKPIGYRPPHTGQQAIQKLRQDYEDYQNKLLDAAAKRYRQKITPVPVRGYIYGIRGWLVSDNNLLESLVISYEWSETIAREQVTPKLHGVRGFWAVKPNSIGLVQRYMPQVIGLVRLSGTVIEHEKGWRGEVCTIDRLVMVSNHFRRYDGPVHPLKPFELRTWSVKDLRSLRQELEDKYQCDVDLVSPFSLAFNLLMEAHR